MLLSTKIKNKRIAVEALFEQLGALAANFDDLRKNPLISHIEVATRGQRLLTVHNQLDKAYAELRELESILVLTYRSQKIYFHPSRGGYKTDCENAPFKWLEPTKQGTLVSEWGKHYRIKGNRIVYHQAVKSC